MLEKSKVKKEQNRLYPFLHLSANFKKYSGTNNYSIDENMIPGGGVEDKRLEVKGTDASDSKYLLEAKDVLKESTSA